MWPFTLEFANLSSVTLVCSISCAVKKIIGIASDSGSGQPAVHDVTSCRC